MTDPAVSPPSGAAEPGLPRYLLRRDGGVFVDLAQLESSADFRRLVDRVFRSGAYFAGLDYGRFVALLYDYDAHNIADEVRVAHTRGRAPEVRFAADILTFRPERRALYKALKVGGGEAEYLFEPVMIERWTEQPVFETDDDGNEVQLRTERVPQQERAVLDFDEFVAESWAKGVRFGIDAAAVRGAMHSGFTGRLTVAYDLPASVGSDAGIAELTTALHRDNAPKVLTHGRADLSQFKNRFPQVVGGTRLLKKIPRALGRPGRDVSGTHIEPPVPKDIDFAALAGPGTELLRIGHDEIIAAAIDGFLTIDKRSNQVLITDHMVNRDGVSMRTTGDLALSGDLFEEFGEVQERRTVEGYSITVHADVFGKISSLGGAVVLERNLIGGTAGNADGPITVGGVASGAVMVGAKGTVTVTRAENCLLVGARVRVEVAVNCEILGDEVDIDQAQGCTVVGRRIHIATSRPGRHSETRILVLVPDLTSHEAHLAALAAQREEILSGMARRERQIETMGEARRCAELMERVKNKEVSLNPQQASQVRRMVEQYAPQMRSLAALQEQLQSLRQGLETAQAALATATEARRTAGEGIACEIEAIAGDVTVCQFPLAADAPPLAEVPPRELRARLRIMGSGSERICRAASGTLSWTYPSPQGTQA